MEIGNKSILTTANKVTPAKSIKATPVKLTSNSPATSSTPLKRKRESTGTIAKKIKFEQSHVEEEYKKTSNHDIPANVMSMGSGDTGQLGLGEDVLEKKRATEILDLVNIISVRAGGMHSICLSNNGKVYTFGCNDEGALGRPIVEDEEATVPGEVQLPADIEVADITAGDNHSSVLTTDGKVYIWGSFRDNNGLIGLMKPYEKLLKPTLIPTEKKIIKIASGENHFAMLTESGDILTFGVAEQGQLGRISPINLVRGGRGGLLPLLIPSNVRVKHGVKFCDLWAGAFCTVGKSIDGDVYGCGLNNYKQLGLKEDLMQLMMTNLTEFNKLEDSWKTFVFGQHHTMALTINNKIYVIGRGEYGNLGQGNNEHCEEITEVKLNSDDIHSIAACNRTSYALMNDGSVFSWGMGSSYQLGHGDDEDVNVPTKMIGKQLAEKKIIEISPGFQHVLFRAIPKEENKKQPIEIVESAVVENINIQSTTDVSSDLICSSTDDVTQPTDESIVVPMETIEETETLEDILTVKEPNTIFSEMDNNDFKEDIKEDNKDDVKEDNKDVVNEEVKDVVNEEVTSEEMLITEHEITEVTDAIEMETITETSEEQSNIIDDKNNNDSNNNALQQMKVDENQEN